MKKHVHRVINLANEDVDLVGTFNKHGGVSGVLQHSWVSHLCKSTSASLVKHQSKKKRHCHCNSSLVCSRFEREELSLINSLLVFANCLSKMRFCLHGEPEAGKVQAETL